MFKSSTTIQFQYNADCGFSFQDFCARFYALNEVLGHSFSYNEYKNNIVSCYYLSNSIRDLCTFEEIINIMLKSFGMNSATFHFEMLDK